MAAVLRQKGTSGHPFETRGIDREKRLVRKKKRVRTEVANGEAGKGKTFMKACPGAFAGIT